MRKVKILVSGRVQGVYFRMFTQRKANQLGINGSVRNLPDGRVEAIGEAENAVLEQFIEWCRKGPVTARVDQVEITELEHDEELTSFEIK
jgi:acylphosphatase